MRLGKHEKALLSWARRCPGEAVSPNMYPQMVSLVRKEKIRAWCWWNPEHTEYCQANAPMYFHVA